MKYWLNSSALKRSSCDQAFAYMCAEGLISKEFVEPLTYGTAMHTFAEVAMRLRIASPTMDPDDILDEAGSIAFKKYIAAGGEDPANFKLVTMHYDQIASIIPLPTMHKGLPLVEQWFEFPYRSVQVCGTIDHISFGSDGWIKIYDYKTSRKSWRQGEVMESYAVSTQMPFYAWSIRTAPEQFSDDPAFIAAAKAGKIIVHIIGIFISTTKSKPVPEWVIGAGMIFSKQELDAYEEMLNAFIPSIIKIYEQKRGMRNGWVSNLCDKCPYQKLCHAEEGLKEIIHKEFYITKEYNPKHN